MRRRRRQLAVAAARTETSWSTAGCLQRECVEVKNFYSACALCGRIQDKLRGDQTQAREEISMVHCEESSIMDTWTKPVQCAMHSRRRYGRSHQEQASPGTTFIWSQHHQLRTVSRRSPWMVLDRAVRSVKLLFLHSLSVPLSSAMSLFILCSTSYYAVPTPADRVGGSRSAVPDR